MRGPHWIGRMRGKDSTGEMVHPQSITRSCARTTFETTQLPPQPVAPGEGRHYYAFSRMGANLKTGECIVGKVLLVVLVVIVVLVAIGWFLRRRGGARRH